MPKININGVVRKMTAEEIAEMERIEAEAAPPSLDLMEVMENALNELGVETRE